MARRKIRKHFDEEAVVSKSSDNCIVKVSIEQRRVIVNRLPELWRSEGYTSTDYPGANPKTNK